MGLLGALFRVLGSDGAKVEVVEERGDEMYARIDPPGRDSYYATIYDGFELEEIDDE